MSSARPSALLLLAALVSCKEDQSEAHHRLAIDLYAKGDFARAAEEYDKTAEFNPKLDPEVRKKGALAWIKAGQPGKASAVLERLAGEKTGPERLKAFKETGALFMDKANDPEEAERWYGRVLAEAPDDKDALSWMAEIASIRGGARSAAKPANAALLDLALQRYDKIIELEPENSAPQVSKRVVLLKYIDYLDKQRVASLADADANKADKDVAADFRKTAEDLGARAETMRSALEQVNKRLGELNKAQKK